MPSDFGGTRNGAVIRWPEGIESKDQIRSQFSNVIDIAPPILEAAGLPEPKSVNGTPQTPIEGTSMGYALNDAGAAERHTTQYFGMFGNRAIRSLSKWSPSSRDIYGLGSCAGGCQAPRGNHNWDCVCLVILHRIATWTVFDSLHLGHTKMIAAISTTLGGLCLVLTFATAAFADGAPEASSGASGGPAAAAVAAPVQPPPPLEVHVAPQGIAAADQPRLLAAALRRYREIQARGGWEQGPTDYVIGAPYAYECWRIDALENRMIAEGYLARLSSRPKFPVVTEQAVSGADGEAAGVKKVSPEKGTAVVYPDYVRCPYTRELAEAVATFQYDRKVRGTGQLTTSTMHELNRPVEDIIAIIEQDLERWMKFKPEDSGTFILVTIPFFELRLYQNAREELQMPVVVGMPSWATPVMDDAIEYVIVNPSWGIPTRIAKEEYWPHARRDPDYLRRQGIEAEGGSLRQKPGPNNPLGRIKFVMPNEHDIYLHDTPHQRAFDAKVKALSHGCVRLSQPLDLATALLDKDGGWTRSAIEASIASRASKRVNLAQPMPVHIVYATSRVNEAGRLELRPDVYGRNRVSFPGTENVSEP